MSARWWTCPYPTIAAGCESGSGATRFIAFILAGMALGYVLSWIAARSRGAVWLGLVARLLLFVAVIAVLARSFGPAAGLTALVASVVTRGLLVRTRPHASR